MLLIDKYKPGKISNLVLKDKIKNQLEKVQNQNLLITGNTGSGKTTALYCIARNNYHGMLDDAVYVLNVIDDRSLKSIQDTLEIFCKKKIEHTVKKMIIIDDLDELSDKIQQVINNLMETYEKKVIFAFTCNNTINVIEQIQGRCIILHFNKLNTKLIYEKLKEICNNEQFTFDEDGLKQICYDADGNLKKAINNLQLISNYSNNINLINVRKILNIPIPELINDFFNFCLNKQFNNAHSQIINMKHSGLMSFDILNGLIQYLKIDEKIDADKRIKFLEIISEFIIIISKGIDSELQLTACVAKLILC
jgi:replication factor C subunit 2/4